jgi:F-type H+-transporting ATPase subunit b
MRIDWWTLALQTANVLILIWLLGRFFYRPLANLIEKRRAVSAGLLLEAQEAHAAAETERAEIAATRQGFAAERERVLSEARKQAQSEHDIVLKDAAAAAEKLRSDNDVQMVLERKRIDEQAMHRAAALAVDIARKLLQKLPADLASTSFLESLAGRIKTLPPSSLKLLVASARETGLEVVTAAPLNDALTAEYRKMIENFLGENVNLTYRCDPSLIAGAQIRNDKIVVSNDWYDDLTLIQRELTEVNTVDDRGQPERTQRESTSL